MSTNFSNLSSIQQNPPCENLAATFPVKITLMVVLPLIFFFSFVGNNLLIITVYKHKELKKTVNYFIVNMAVSDFVFPLTTIPVPLAEMSSGSWQWPIGGTAGSILCKLRNFLRTVSLTVSIESLVLIALDRFVAVVWPMKIHLITSRFRSLAIASTWIVAVTANAVDLYYSELLMGNGKIRCSNLDRTSLLFIAISYVRLVFFGIAPMVLITILYFIFTLRKQDKMLQCTTVHRNGHKKRQAIKMSLCIVGLFYMLYLPYVSALVLWETSVSKTCLYKHLFLVSTLVVHISSTTNPIVCFAFVESFRRGLREVFKLPQRKRLETNAVGKREKEEVTLKKITVLHEMDARI